MSDDSEDGDLPAEEDEIERSVVDVLKSLIKAGDMNGVLCMLETGDLFPECLSDTRFVKLLSTAAACGQAEILDMLLTRGFRPLEDDVTPPLHMACKEGQTDIVTLLFEKWNMDLMKPDGRGRLPLYHAIVNDHFETVKCLVELGVDINKGTIMPPLLVSIINYKREICQYLIEKGADVDTKDYFGRSPLTAAARGAKNDILRMLLIAGADVNLRGRHATPFQAACMAGHVNSAMILYRHGAEVTRRDRDGDNALHLSVLNEHYKVSRYLLVELNMVPYSANINSKTALHNAIENVDKDIVMLLRETGYMLACEMMSTFSFEAFKFSQPNSFPKQVQRFMNRPYSLQELACFKVRQVLSTRNRQEISALVHKLFIPEEVKEMICLEHIPSRRSRRHVVLTD